MTKSTMRNLILFCLLLSGSFAFGNEPVSQNPLVPGYFADPTIKKFGDTFYIYATTDGEKLASGQPTVWMSKDFVNWYNYEIDVKVPTGLTNCWAPDVVIGADGKYYYFMGNCQAGCNIYGYVSDNPMGPWSPINNGKAIIPVGTGKKDLPALDAQFLTDDDGSVYSYFGTWCTSFGGIGWAKFNPTNWSIEKEGLIPINQVPSAFEASYPIKRNGKYILMYSAGDCRLSTYAVHYSWSNHPEGPFVPGNNNPILSTNADATVDSPGHHSMLQNGDEYYMIYHRHDNPHSSGGMFRQICADQVIFANDTTIETMVPTHVGVGFLGENQIPQTNYALGAKASATSYYHLKSSANQFNKKAIDYSFAPELATDDNNGTLWKAESAQLPQSLVIDLGKSIDLKRITTQFEHATMFYQYKLEVSDDSTSWILFSDKTSNLRSGSPMIDDNDVSGRYVRLTVTGVEKTGVFAAVWNLKVYDSLFEVPSFQNSEVTNSLGEKSTESCLVDLRIDDLEFGKVVNNLDNNGTLGGTFVRAGSPVVAWIDSVKAVLFNGSANLRLSKIAPKSLAWNAPYTASAWVYNPSVGAGECLMVWTSRNDMLMGSYTALMYGKGNYGAVAHGDGFLDIPFKIVPAQGKWQHIVVTYDGMLEKVYVNGQLNTQLPVSLFVENSTIRIGASGETSENYTGYIANAQLYDKALTALEVQELMKTTKPAKVTGPTGIGMIDKTDSVKIRYDSSKKKILIESGSFANGMIDASLYDVSGRELSKINFSGNDHQTTFDIQTTGIYVVVLDDGTKSYSQKVSVN